MHAQNLSQIGNYLLGLLILVAIIIVPIIFFQGTLWASEHLLEPLINLGWIVFAINIIIFLPVSIVKKWRAFSGISIFISSYLFGAILYFSGFIISYSIWGVTALVIGLFLLGVGVVPIALLATLVHGLWIPFFIMVALCVLTYGSRMIGITLAASSE